MEDSLCKAASYFPNFTCQLFMELSGLIPSPPIVTQLKNCSAMPPVLSPSSNMSNTSTCMLPNMTVDGSVIVIIYHN